MKIKVFPAIAAFIATQAFAAPCDVSLKSERGPSVVWNEQGVPKFSKVLKWSAEKDTGADVEISWSPILREQNSILGAFWMFPLLDSFCTKLSDGEYFVCKPDGRTLKLTVTKSEKSGDGVVEYLDGPGGWKGIVRHKTVTLHSSCGTRMIFADGKISSLSVKGNDYRWRHGNNSVSLEENGNSLVELSLGSGGGVFVELSGKRYEFKKKKIKVDNEERSVLASGAGFFDLNFTDSGNLIFVESNEGWMLGFDPRSNRITHYNDLRFNYKQPDFGVVPEISISDIKYNTLKVGRADVDAGLVYSQFWSKTDGVPVLERESRTEYHTSGVLKGSIKFTLEKDENGARSWAFVYNELGQCISKKNQAGLLVDTTMPVEVVKNIKEVGDVLKGEFGVIEAELFDSISKKDAGRMSRATMKLWVWCRQNYYCNDGVKVMGDAMGLAKKDGATAWIAQSLEQLSRDLKEFEVKYRVQ